MPISESLQKAQQKYKENVKNMNIRMSKEIFDMFNDYCQQTGETKKEVFEKAITEYIDKH